MRCRGHDGGDAGACSDPEACGILTVSLQTAPNAYCQANESGQGFRYAPAIVVSQAGCMDILIILGLILLNGMFAMSEIAIVSARRGRLQRAADGGDAGAAKALQLATEPTRFLSTIQVGITLVGILVGAMGEASFVRGLEAWFASHELTRPIATGLAWALMVIMVTYASLIFGELVPKRIALIN